VIGGSTHVGQSKVRACVRACVRVCVSLCHNRCQGEWPYICWINISNGRRYRKYWTVVHM